MSIVNISWGCGGRTIWKTVREGIGPVTFDPFGETEACLLCHLAPAFPCLYQCLRLPYPSILRCNPLPELRLTLDTFLEADFLTLSLLRCLRDPSLPTPCTPTHRFYCLPQLQEERAQQRKDSWSLKAEREPSRRPSSQPPNKTSLYFL